jgi:hypothetical protein
MCFNANWPSEAYLLYGLSPGQDNKTQGQCKKMNIRNVVREGNEQKAYFVGHNCPTASTFPRSAETAPRNWDETLGRKQSTFTLMTAAMNPGRWLYPIPETMPQMVDLLLDWCPHQDPRMRSMVKSANSRRDWSFPQWAKILNVEIWLNNGEEWPNMTYFEYRFVNSFLIDSKKVNRVWINS